MIKKQDPIGVINQALWIFLRPNDSQITPILFKYFLTSPLGNHSLIENSGGSAQINIAKRAIIENIPIALFPKEIQRRIEKHLLSIDSQIEIRRLENKYLEGLVNIILSRMAKG